MEIKSLVISYILFLVALAFVVLPVAILLMLIITKKLTKLCHGEKRWLKVVKIIALLALLIIICSFNGCVVSYFSGNVTIAKDYTTEETVGITSFRGFPIWYDQAAPGIRIGLIPNRIFANWCVWTTVFLLFCCGLYYMKTKSRFMLPVGIILGMGCASMVTFLLLTATDSSIPTHVKTRANTAAE